MQRDFAHLSRRWMVPVAVATLLAGCGGSATPPPVTAPPATATTAAPTAAPTAAVASASPAATSAPTPVASTAFDLSQIELGAQQLLRGR